MSLDGIILAGGASTRYGDEDKTLAEVGGEPLVLRAALTLAEVGVDRIIVASGTPQRAFAHTAALVSLDLEVKCVPDNNPTQSLGPLAGLIAALPHARADFVAIAPGDAPFLEPDLYDLLAERAREHGLAAAVETPAGPHPLVSVCRRDALTRFARQLWVLGERSLRAVLEDFEYAAVTEDEAREVDPDLLSLRAVSTPADVEGANRLVEAHLRPDD